MCVLTRTDSHLYQSRNEEAAECIVRARARVSVIMYDAIRKNTDEDDLGAIEIAPLGRKIWFNHFFNFFL